MCTWSAPSSRCSRTAIACAVRLATIASAAGSDCSARKGGRARDGRHRQAYKITSNSWEYTGDGHALAYNAGAELMDMEFVQFHPTGMVWPPSVRGILVTEGVRGEGGVLKNKRRRAVHVRRHSGQLQERRRRTTPRRAGATRRATRTRGGRPSCSRATTLRAASCARCRRGAAVRTAACISISRGSRRSCRTRKSTSRRSCRACTISSSSSADIDITTTPMEVGPTTHYMMGGVRVDGETQMSTVPGLFAAGEVCGGIARRQPARRQFAVGPAGVRKAGRRVCGEVREGKRPRRRSISEQVDARSEATRSRHSSARRRAKGRIRCSMSCRT